MNCNKTSCNENNLNCIPDKGNDHKRSCLFSLPPEQFALLSALIGILLLINLDLDEQNSLGNFIVGVGQTMLTAAAQGSLLKQDTQNNDQVRQQIRSLKSQIATLEQLLDKIN